MMREELEGLLGFAINDYGWREMEKMYMASVMNKEEFADLVRAGAKKNYRDPFRDDVDPNASYHMRFVGYNRNVQSVYEKVKTTINIATGEIEEKVMYRCDDEGEKFPKGLDIVVKTY